MLNAVVLIGRMVADPELKYTPSGVAVCQFRIAVDRRFKSESGEKQADFIDIVAWRQSAEFAANYLAKGRLIAVQGRLQSRSWVDEKTQLKRYKTEVVCDSIQGLDRGNADVPSAATMAQELGEEPEDYDVFADA